jgi:hypothetical protein
MRKDRWNLAIFILLCDKSHHARFHVLIIFNLGHMPACRQARNGQCNHSVGCSANWRIMAISYHFFIGKYNSN